MTLSECPFYQGILTALTQLNSLVKNDPTSFDKEWLSKIETELWEIRDAVNEGVI